MLFRSDHIGWFWSYCVAALLFLACALACLCAPREPAATRATFDTSASAELAMLLARPGIAFAIALFVLGLLWPVTASLPWEGLADARRSWWFKAGIPVAAFLIAGLLIARQATGRSADGPSRTHGPVFGALLELMERPGILPLMVFIQIGRAHV